MKSSSRAGGGRERVDSFVTEFDTRGVDRFVRSKGVYTNDF